MERGGRPVIVDGRLLLVLIRAHEAATCQAGKNASPFPNG
jgi:hypothetical protein